MTAAGDVQAQQAGGQATGGTDYSEVHQAIRDTIDKAKADRSRRRVKIATPDTWPDLRFIFRPLPWTWRLIPRGYVESWGRCEVQWMFLTIEWWAEDKPRWWFVENEQRTAAYQDLYAAARQRLAAEDPDTLGHTKASYRPLPTYVRPTPADQIVWCPSCGDESQRGRAHTCPPGTEPYDDPTPAASPDGGAA